MATAGDRYEHRTGNIWSYAHRGDLTGLKAALSRGVDVNLPNTVGWTPAHAAAAGGQTKVLRFLAKNDADLEVADRGGDVPAHQAAKNGHVQALRVLQELGADVTRVRLSQAKGKAVREELIRAYQKAGRNTANKCNSGDVEDDDESEEEEEVAVGYARKQAKSTAFWGPRRQPISTKIKKKIIKEKRLKKKEKLERKCGNHVDEEDGNDTADGSSNDAEIVEGPHEEPASAVDACEQQDASYIETVRKIKRNKKHRRRQQQMRQRQQKQDVVEESPVISDDETSKKDIQSEDSHYGTSSEDEEGRANDASRSAVNGFAALSLMDSSDSENE